MSSMLIVIDMQNDFVDGALARRKRRKLRRVLLKKLKIIKGRCSIQEIPMRKIISRHLKEKVFRCRTAFAAQRAGN